MTDIASVQLEDFDVTSPAVLADAFAAYRALVPCGVAFRSEAMNAVVVRDYGTVRTALNDPRLSARHSVQQLGAGPAVDLGVFGRVSTLPTSDPPNHTRLRKLVNKAFTPSTVRDSLPLCQRIVSQAVNRAKDRGQLDVARDIAAPLPSQVIAGMLGVPDQDWPLFKKWSDDLFGAFKGASASAEELEAASVGARSLEDYLRNEIRSRPADRNQDLIDRIRLASDGEDALTEDEILATCIVLLVGGNETTTGLIVNGFWGLAHDPAAVERLKAQPELVPSAIEEFLRLWGPVHLIARKATETVQFGDETAEAGESVLLLTAAANRDPRAFDDPDSLRVDRDPNEHLAFGRGRHFCLGASLARLEAAATFAGVLHALPDIRMVEGSRPQWGGPLAAHRVDEVLIEA